MTLVCIDLKYYLKVDLLKQTKNEMEPRTQNFLCLRTYFIMDIGHQNSPRKELISLWIH